MTHTLGDAPIEDRYREQMQTLARLLDRYLNGDGPKENGFILMMFPFYEVKEGGRCNYISNAQRADVVAMLKEQIARFEGQVTEPASPQSDPSQTRSDNISPTPSEEEY